MANTIRIIGADLLIDDEELTIPSQEALAAMPDELRDSYVELNNLRDRILANHGANRGDKISIDEKEYKELAAALSGIDTKTEPGGSTADTLTTLKGLMGNGVAIDFLGVAGQGVNGNTIRGDLKKTGINLIAEDIPSGEAAVSFIFMEPDGSRTLATYPGNAAEVLKPELITDAMVQQVNALFLPVSLWGKFGKALPEALFHKCITSDKELIVTLPKQAQFNYKMPNDTIQKVLQNADIIVGDEAELAQVYGTGNNFEQAISRLQADMARRDEIRKKAEKPPRKTSAVAFITNQNFGATVITAPSPPGVIPATPAGRYDVSLPQKGYTLGSGDAAYAGFLAGILSGLTPEQSAGKAIETAGTKELYPQVRIPGPEESDKTQKHWTQLRSGLGSGFVNALRVGQTGENQDTQKLDRTRGQKIFDALTYGGLINTLVFAGSVAATWLTTYGKQDTFLRKRGDASRKWGADKLVKNFHMDQGKAEATAKDLFMVLWSFIDGSILAIPAVALEKIRKPVSRGLDRTLGSAPEDDSVYEQEPKRSWKHLLQARIATFTLVISNYFLFRKMNWNEKLFYRTGREMGDSNPVRSVFPKSAEKVVSDDKGNKLPLLRALGEIVTFEAFYTSLCTFGLWLGAKIFASKNKQVEQKQSDPGSINLPQGGQQGATEQGTVQQGNMQQGTVIREPGRMDSPEAYAAYGQVQRNKPVEKQPEKFAERQHGEQTQGTAPISM